MGRVLVLILIVVLAVWLIRRALRPRSSDVPQARKAVEGDLVACARCGVNLPRNDARQVMMNRMERFEQIERQLAQANLSI